MLTRVSYVFRSKPWVPYDFFLFLSAHKCPKCALEFCIKSWVCICIPYSLGKYLSKRFPSASAISGCIILCSINYLTTCPLHLIHVLMFVVQAQHIEMVIRVYLGIPMFLKFQMFFQINNTSCLLVMLWKRTGVHNAGICHHLKHWLSIGLSSELYQHICCPKLPSMLHQQLKLS